MESTPSSFDPRDADAALSAAHQAQRDLAARLRLPRGLYPVLAVAIAIQVAAASYGIATQSLAGLAIALGGLAVFLATAGFYVHRFQRVNRVRLDGLTSQILLVAGGSFSLLYLGALAAGIWAAFESRWWLVAGAAVVAGIACTLGVHRWWRAYQTEPTTGAHGASPQVLAALAIATGVAFAALLIFS